MINYIVYRITDGMIKRTGYCPDDMFFIQASGMGEAVIEGTANDVTQYVDLLTLNILDKTVMHCSINKTTMIADNVDSITISNLPNPSRVNIKEEGSWFVTDSIFVFTTDTPGKYIITCTVDIYLKVEYTINAN